jgi:hypothetical protein
MKAKPRRKPTLFTDALRRELCGQSWYLGNDPASVNLVAAVDHNWDGKALPTLRKVVTSAVEDAYRRGLEQGANQVRDGIKSLLRAR